MAKRGHLITSAIAVALVFGMLAHVSVARADLLDDLLNQSNNNPDSQKALKQAKAKDPTGTGSTATTAAPTTTTSGPAIVPAATPLVVDSYSADPAQLQAGTRFALSLSIKNPGADDADDVVVQIGPSTDAGWGGDDALAVLGSGSAKYIGAVASGATNNNATFQLIANPSAPGGMRSVPVKITWKSQGYEHDASEVVGLLINSYVSLDTTIGASGSATQQQPFNVSLGVTNDTSRTVKSVSVAFSGSGATPSSGASVTVGDLAPGMTRQVPMKFTAPLAGRAKLMATISYVDDFGDVRSVSVTGWAKVVRPTPPAPTDDTSDSGSALDQVVAAVEALFGLSG